AIGGTIGTGIFLSAGSAVSVAGPAGALLSYAIVGIFCYGVVITLGEMTAYIPVTGTFAQFATRFVSPALGFTLGWNYWLQWALSIPSELTAAAVILQYWTTKLTTWEWAIIIIVPIFAMQLIHVRVYGESEYWFALIKVVLIVVFIIVGLIYDWGGIVGHPGPGLANFQNGQAFIGGFHTFAQTFAYAFYSYGGVELVSLAAGESSRPHITIPRAVKATFFRIIIFYVLTMLTIGLCINWQDPTLLNAAYSSSVSASPITVVFVRAGFGAAVHVVNAVLLTAVLSATNSCFYASSRMMLALARAGQAPRVFGWVNRRGVPVPANMLTLAVSCLTFLTTIWGDGVVFTWFINLTGISSLLVWATIGAISLRFRAAWRAQGRDLADLPYRQPLFPVLPLMVVVLGVLMFIAQGYAAVVQEPFSARNIVATYIGLGLYIVAYVGYTLWARFVVRAPHHFVPLDEVDLDTDAVWAPGEGAAVRAREADAQRMQDEADAQTPGLQYWLKRARRAADSI
ncbi:hypothetical protein PHLGIDRAFT_79723, partial [Phlebiopsis gigantea 11061_1 CR5-6]